MHHSGSCQTCSGIICHEWLLGVGQVWAAGYDAKILRAKRDEGHLRWEAQPAFAGS